MSAVVIKQLLLVKHPFQKAVLFACNRTQTNNVPPVLWPVVVPERCIISNERSNSSSMYLIPPTSSFSYRKDDEVKEEYDLSLYISIMNSTSIPTILSILRKMRSSHTMHLIVQLLMRDLTGKSWYNLF